MLSDDEFYEQAALVALSALISKVPLADRGKNGAATVSRQRDDIAESASDYGAALVRARRSRLNEH